MTSLAELFKIGIGPSSSHTVGPMKAARAFIVARRDLGDLCRIARIVVTLYGSLAWTGRGHGTDRAVVLGLAGEEPATVEPDSATALISRVCQQRILPLAGFQQIAFDPERDIVFDQVTAADCHPNTLEFCAFDSAGAAIAAERWCSIGGGFVLREAEVGAVPKKGNCAPFDFVSAKELLALGHKHGMTISEIVYANECSYRTADEVDRLIEEIDAAMMACIERGLRGDGALPGALNVKRRAKSLFERLQARRSSNARPPHEMMDWVSLYAIAVNEENAAGGRVVTAPTNGAAGVVPAVLRYYRESCDRASSEGVKVFLLAATAVGSLIKRNASISGAEVGCQGEVGAACSMAAAGLAAALGGTNAQIENAAEIAMEHHLGMTCDPIGGLVQIPCIERNAFGAIKAITAASLALNGTGDHHVSLDRVIATMRQTGADMQVQYKETSQGGLAVNLAEC